MKLSFLLTIIGLSNIYATVLSQGTVTVDLDTQNVTLKNVIDNIERQTSYKFIYRSDLIDVNQTTSMDSKEETTIDELLATLLKGTSIDYNVLGDNLIVLTPQQQKQGQISGKVTDATTGEPLVGVSIVVKGTTKGTVTDVNGSYSIEVSGDAVLAFSYVGYVSEEFPVTGRTIIDVKLIQDIKKLDEVVVVGYGTQKKIDVIGAVSTMSNKSIEKVAVTDPLQALQGKMAGVQILAKTGQPGAGYDIRIRGVQSYGASASPIYVIDGVITDKMTVNPYDIDNISILKDGASAAIYGARAANGVIVITTKKGSKGQAPVISFDAYRGISTFSNRKLELLNSDQWFALHDEAHLNDGKVAGVSLDQARGYSDADINSLRDPVTGQLRNTDWMKEITQNGNVGHYQLSLLGGTEKSTFYSSLGYSTQTGLFKTQEAKSLNFRLNSDHKISKFIEFGQTLSLTAGDDEGLPDPNQGNFDNGVNQFAYAIRKHPTTRVFETNGTYAGNDISNIQYTWLNPVAIMNKYKRDHNYKGVIGDIHLKFNLLEGLAFTPKVSLTYMQNDYMFYTPAITLPISAGNPLSNLDKSFNNELHWQTDYLLTYDRTFNKVHNLSALLGYSQEERTYEYFQGKRSNVPDDVYYLEQGDASTQTLRNTYEDWSFASIIGSLNYDYNGKYLIQATIRRDGSSRFAEGKKYGVFPSVSLGWRISKEKFMESLSDIINDLKIRGGLGILGNASVGNYPTILASVGGTTIFNDKITTYFTQQNVANPNLVWETTKKYNIGLDAALFNSKLYFTADYFISQTTDLLYQTLIPNSSGKVGLPYLNGGQMDNKGVEFELGFRDKKGDFSYDISTNFSVVRNEMVNLPGQDPVALYTSGVAVGKPFRSYFGYKATGLIKTQAELDAYKAKYATSSYIQGVQIGDVMWEDVDGKDANGKLTGTPDGIINENDRTIIGKAYPDFTYGLVANVSYKAFSLQIQGQGVRGIDLPIYSGVAMSYFHGGNPVNMSNTVLDRYHPVNNPDGDLPRLTKLDPGHNFDFSSIWLSNASYFRINSINLSWDMPANLANKLRTKGLRLFVGVQNLYTITKWKGTDPAVSVGNGFVADGTTPGAFRATDRIAQPRTWMAGIKLSL